MSADTTGRDVLPMPKSSDLQKGAVFQSEINFTARAEFYAVDFEAQLDAFIRKYRL
jgi:hypothetical protein